jgi:hypothetical protein
MGAPTKTADHVDSINVDDRFALNVKREPAKGKTSWHVVTTLAAPDAEPRRNRAL